MSTMNFQRLCKILKFRPKPEVRDACQFLEDRGLQFCGTFGLDNAIEIAGEVIMATGDAAAINALWRTRGIKFPVLPPPPRAEPAQAPACSGPEDFA